MECKKPRIRKIQLAVVALTALYLLTEYAWYLMGLFIIIRTIRGKGFSRHQWLSLGLAVDDVAGTIIYGTKRHTVSANIGLRQSKGDKFHTYLAKAIDYFFGKNHCMCLAYEEGLLERK